MQLGYDPKYVLDEMDMVEAKVAIKYGYYAHKDEWETARAIAYLIAQTNSTKKLKPQDIIPLSWDKKEEDKPYEVTKEEREALNRRAEQIKQIFMEESKS